MIHAYLLVILINPCKLFCNKIILTNWRTQTYVSYWDNCTVYCQAILVII